MWHVLDLYLECGVTDADVVVAQEEVLEHGVSHTSRLADGVLLRRVVERKYRQRQPRTQTYVLEGDGEERET